MEEETPESEPIILIGVVEELKYSKLKVKILSNEGVIYRFLSDELTADHISPFWGKEIIRTVINHFKSNRTSVVEIKRVHQPNDSDSYFSRKSKKSFSIEDQLKE